MNYESRRREMLSSKCNQCETQDLTMRRLKNVSIFIGSHTHLSLIMIQAVAKMVSSSRSIRL